MSGLWRTFIGRSAVIVLALIGPAGCGSSSQPETSPPESSSASTSVAAEPLDGVWSTGPVSIEDIRAAMLAAGLEDEAVEGWIDDQGSPSEFTFEMRFDSPNFTHSEANPHMPMQVGESGTYELVDGQLRLSIAGLGDGYVFDAALSEDTLSLELVDVLETGTVEDRAVHRLFTVAFYASAPFVRQP